MRRCRISGFDILVLCVVGLMVAMGLWKGLILQVFGLAGIIFGYILSVKYYIRAVGLLPDMNPGTAKIAGFLAIFIGCIVAAFIAGRLLEKLVSSAGLGWANRILGGALGLLKGMLIVMVIMVILAAFLPADNRMLRESVTVPYLISVTKIFGIAIPEDIKVKYKNRIELLELLQKSGEHNK